MKLCEAPPEDPSPSGDREGRLCLPLCSSAGAFPDRAHSEAPASIHQLRPRLPLPEFTSHISRCVLAAFFNGCLSSL